MTFYLIEAGVGGFFLGVVFTMLTAVRGWKKASATWESSSKTWERSAKTWEQVATTKRAS